MGEKEFFIYLEPYFGLIQLLFQNSLRKLFFKRIIERKRTRL